MSNKRHDAEQARTAALGQQPKYLSPAEIQANIKTSEQNARRQRELRETQRAKREADQAARLAAHRADVDAERRGNR